MPNSIMIPIAYFRGDTDPVSAAFLKILYCMS